jgi:hypothetical protein
VVRAVPRAAQISSEVAGESELAVAGDDQPGPVREDHSHGLGVTGEPAGG